MDFELKGAGNALNGGNAQFCSATGLDALIKFVVEFRTISHLFLGPTAFLPELA